ncbi:MAG TPA: Hsp20/alpha crystallin family protein [Gemmatimonadaceae bacterium]|nr:Hsp20/alpha crystallin family protein [Gemmatimonadaceae bacterium]
MLQLFRNRFATPAFFESTLEPWSDLRREIDRVFDTVMSGTQPAINGEPRWSPPMNLEEHDDLIRLSVELPGVSPKDVNITVENGVLTISGEKKMERENEASSGGARIYECRYGRFERSLTLPQYIDAEKVTAQYKNGILVLELPKSAESRRKKIEIGVVEGQKQIEGGDRPRKIA